MFGRKYRKRFEKCLKSIDDCTEIQCSPGNYNVSEYMRGMANGLILAQAIMHGGEPCYITPPVEKSDTSIPKYGYTPPILDRVAGTVTTIIECDGVEMNRNVTEFGFSDRLPDLADVVVPVDGSIPVHAFSDSDN